MGTAITQRPGGTFTEIFQTRSEIEAAYRLIENRHLTLDEMVVPGMQELGRALKGCRERGTLLSIQDTTEFDLTKHRHMSGLGPIGNPECRGVFLHTSLAATTSGIPEGLLEVRTWVRSLESRGKARKRRARKFDEKESVKWWETMMAAEEAVDCPGLLVHVMDREADIYELFERSAQTSRLLVRAFQDRRVEGQPHLLWAATERWPLLGREVLEVPERPAHEGHAAQRARKAGLSLRFGKVTLPATPGKKGRVEMNVIRVQEVDAPSDEERLEWLLLTNDTLQTEEDAWERVKWYRFRWIIEELHKCLKTGCRVEERAWKTRNHFEVSLAFFMLASVKLLRMTKLGRVSPDSPAREVISELEETVVRLYIKESGRSCEGVLTLLQTIVAIAGMGGYRGRSGDGYPGWQTLWRGYQRLSVLVEGFRLAYVHLGAPPWPTSPPMGTQVFDKLITFASCNWPDFVATG